MSRQDEDRAAAHSDTGLKGVLEQPWAYRLFKSLIGGTRAVERLVRDLIKPFPGCRILDIGCGTGDLPAYLPSTIGGYDGLDMNPAYVETARQRWTHRPELTFHTQQVGAMTVEKPGQYDIVLAVAIVHHLDDEDADRLFAAAHEALKPGGRLITYDNAFIDQQNWIAKWLISQDRGTRVRTPDGYRSLAARRFGDVTGVVLHDTLRVPYTIFAMTCTK